MYRSEPATILPNLSEATVLLFSHLPFLPLEAGDRQTLCVLSTQTTPCGTAESQAASYTAASKLLHVPEFLLSFGKNSLVPHST